MESQGAKVLAMFLLGVGSLIFGLLPTYFTTRIDRHTQSLTLSNLLCFGAGVLLATSLVHMLPEVRENFSDYPEVVLCSGFLLVYVFDELIHYIFGAAIQRLHDDGDSRRIDDNGNRAAGATNYGSTSTERQSLLGYVPILTHTQTNQYFLRFVDRSC